MISRFIQRILKMCSTDELNGRDHQWLAALLASDHDELVTGRCSEDLTPLSKPCSEELFILYSRWGCAAKMTKKHVNTAEASVTVGGQKRQLWTAVFRCPRTGEYFYSGVRPGAMVLRGQHCMYYFSKKEAVHAAAATALDILEMRLDPTWGEGSQRRCYGWQRDGIPGAEQTFPCYGMPQADGAHDGAGPTFPQGMGPLGTWGGLPLWFTQGGRDEEVACVVVDLSALGSHEVLDVPAQREGGPRRWRQSVKMAAENAESAVAIKGIAVPPTSSQSQSLREMWSGVFQFIEGRHPDKFAPFVDDVTNARYSTPTVLDAYSKHIAGCGGGINQNDIDALRSLDWEVAFAALESEPVVVDTEESLAEYAKAISSSRVVFFDAEMRVGTEAEEVRDQKTCLVTLWCSELNNRVIVVDVLAVWGAFAEMIGPVFASPEIVKVGHSIGSLDAPSLFRDFGCILVKCLDTQRLFGRVSDGESTEKKSLVFVVQWAIEKYSESQRRTDRLGDERAKGALEILTRLTELKSKYQRQDWMCRPVALEAVGYAALDVRVLPLVAAAMVEALGSESPNPVFLATGKDCAKIRARRIDRECDFDIPDLYSLVRWNQAYGCGYGCGWGRSHTERYRTLLALRMRVAAVYDLPESGRWCGDIMLVRTVVEMPEDECGRVINGMGKYCGHSRRPPWLTDPPVDGRS